MASKLHEILAVEGEVKGAYEKIVSETIKTFTKKPNHFAGHKKVLITATDEGDLEEEVIDQLEITTTVNEKLEYQATSTIRFIDTYLQKEAANQTATAPITVDGKNLTPPLPVTFLLGMETRIKQIREIYAAIPTLANGVKWEEAPNIGTDIYLKTVIDKAPKTQKSVRHKVLVPPTFPKEGESGASLPAQIEKWSETETIGEYQTVQWSGMISSSKKSEMLARIDKLSRGIKKARQQANCQEIGNLKIGKELMGYINNGIDDGLN